MESSNFPYRRLIVIGTTGSGKSTLAEQLLKRLEFEGFSLSNPQGDRIPACKSVTEFTILFVGWKTIHDIVGL